MKLQQQSRRAFTLVEMLVATALVMFIMLILSEAFVAGLEAFRTLKGIGDMEERLRAAALIIRTDLENDHFESGLRLSDPNFWRQGNPNPKQGFVNITQGFTPTTSTTPVAAGMQTTVTVPLTASNNWTIQPFSVLLIDAGTSAAEYVMVQPNPPPTATTFTAVFANMHPPAGSPAGTSYQIQFIRQYEGLDVDGLPVSRATDHVLYLAVKQPGDRQENFFTGHMPYVLPPNPMAPAPIYPLNNPPGSYVFNPFFTTRSDGSPNPNYVPTTFGDQPADARFQDPVPTTSATVGYKTQWAEVAYVLFPNGSTAGGTPLYALYRCEFKVVPDSRYLNGQVYGKSPTYPPLPPPPILPPPPLVSSFNVAAQPNLNAQLAALSASWTYDGFNEMSCQLASAPPGAPYAPNTYLYSFNTPSDLAGSNVPTGSPPAPQRAFTANVTLPGPPAGPVPTRGVFDPTNPGPWSATLVATDVVSFDVQIFPGGAQGSFGGMLATSELPWAQLPNPANPALPILLPGTSDFVDIPTGSFDTARSPNGPTANAYSINAVRIILRVWNVKTNQTRQVSIIQQM